MSVSLCIRLNNTNQRQVREALSTAIRFAKPFEVLASVTERCVFKDAMRELVESHGIAFRAFPGVNDRIGMISCWFNLFDHASGDWIVNIDDDDIALCSLEPENAPKDVAFIHGDVIAVYVYKVIKEGRKPPPGHTLLRKSTLILEKEHANLAYGSYWAMRTIAWKDIAPVVQRFTPGFNDFRIVWHLMRCGWKDQHIDRFVTLQRARPTGNVALYAKMQNEGGWPAVVKELEEKYQ